MLPVTADFLTAAAAAVRKPKARVTVTWTDPYIDQSIVVAANEENRVNYPDQVADAIATVPYKWLHADGTTPLSDGLHPMPAAAAADDYQVGWWGATESGVGGAFSAPYPALTITFTARPVFVLSVSGDDKYSEYPVDFTVALYRSSVLLYTETVTGNTDLDWSEDISAQNITECDEMVLTITKWSGAGRVVKISEFYASVVEVYDGDDIKSLSLFEELEVTDGTLPIGNIAAAEIDLELQNVEDRFFPGNTASPLHTLIKSGRKIEPEIGFELADGTIEYVSLGVFWSGDWDTRELGTVASTSARDRMERLRTTEFSSSSIYIGDTLRDLAIVVLDDAQDDMPDLEYSVDTELGDYTIPYAWFSRKSHLDTLRDIVGACCGRAYVDRDGVVTIVGPGGVV
jgi:hypothetical protein